MKNNRRRENKPAVKRWSKPAYQDLRLGFEYTLYVMTR